MNSDETKDIYTFKCLFAMHLIYRYETLPKICPKFLLKVLLCLVIILLDKLALYCFICCSRCLFFLLLFHFAMILNFQLLSFKQSFILRWNSYLKKNLDQGNFLKLQQYTKLWLSVSANYLNDEKDKFLCNIKSKTFF